MRMCSLADTHLLDIGRDLVNGGIQHHVAHSILVLRIAVAAVASETVLPPLSWAPPHPQYHAAMVMPVVVWFASITAARSVHTWFEAPVSQTPSPGFPSTASEVVFTVNVLMATATSG